MKPSPRPPSAGARSDLRASVLDGAYFSVMVGMGEAYLGAFVLALGFGEIFAGLIATVPMIAGGFLQLGAFLLLPRLRSHRRWVVACATAQACAFVPLIAGAVLGEMPVWSVFAAATLYWGAGMASSPAWNTWIETLVPRRVRVRYFSRRTRVAQGVLLCALLTGGLTLQLGSEHGRTLTSFAVLFSIAFTARLVSTRMLVRHTEPVAIAETPAPPGFATALRGVLSGREGRLIRYLLGVQVAVYISAPYVTPYFLGRLQLSYAEFMTLSATTLVAKSLSAPIFGEVARKVGARRLLIFGGMAIVPVAGLLTLSPRFEYLVLVQMISGFAWSAYELATFLILFETIPRERRTALLTVFNFANASANVVGSLIGAQIARAAGPEALYVVLFASSTAARVLTMLLLRRVPPTEGVMQLAVRPLAVRPEDGAIGRPILGSIAPRPRRDDESAP